MGSRDALKEARGEACNLCDEESVDARLASVVVHPPAKKAVVSALANIPKALTSDAWSLMRSTADSQGLSGIAPSFCTVSVSMHDL